MISNLSTWIIFDSIHMKMSAITFIKITTVLYSMPVTFGLPILVWFPSDPWLYDYIPGSYSRIFPLSDAVGCICYFYLERARGAQMRGEGGVTGVAKIVHGLASKMILAHYLLCQPEARCQVPVRIPVLQGTGKSNSADHEWVWPHWGCS